MEIVDTASHMQDASSEARAAGARIGFVPTMGALHGGHLALLRRAADECRFVVLSIYVNPLQFGPGEDFAGYPRDRDGDAALARRAGVDVLFAPDEGEIHRPGHRTFIEVERMGEALCGRSRPGHFRGVATVVHKLLAIVRPHAAYFGEKDAQQLRIIRRMARDLHEPAAIVGCPTVREADGLALSSRNAYLTPEERRAAPVLHLALREAAAAVERGATDAASLARAARARITAEPLAAIDYVEAVDDEELTPAGAVDRPVLLAVAVRFGRARLIDNIVLRPPASR
jgi:pantoate--beta-alanine ligase